MEYLLQRCIYSLWITASRCAPHVFQGPFESSVFIQMPSCLLLELSGIVPDQILNRLEIYGYIMINHLLVADGPPVIILGHLRAEH